MHDGTDMGAPSLVVLPGLDGTGRLLADFVDAARAMFTSITVVSYPDDAPLDYAALENIARRSLPRSGWFVLLAESFSGPIAISIAASPPANLAGVVLSTTFARNPVDLLRPFAALMRFAPVRALPLPLLSWGLLGRWATPVRRLALDQSLRQVAPAVLRARAAEALRVDASGCLARICVPMLYLRARSDRLILAGAGAEILRGTPRATLVELDGPHMLLQAAPVASAQAVAAFVETLSQ